MKSIFVLLGALLALTSCDREPDRAAPPGTPPPPMASSSAGACQGGGGKVTDPVSAGFFPRRVGGYCVDPNSETRAYGVTASEGIDKVCLEQFNGECELYKSYGLERLVTLRYVDGGGSQGSVAVNLSRFSAKEGGYGFFTRRVIGGMDPAQRAPTALDAGAAAVLGSGSATVWRDRHVVELIYTNELEPVDRVTKLAGQVLPTVAKQIGSRLPGDQQLPVAAAALPAADRLALGISFELAELFGVRGTGSGAIGYYRSQQQRWRVVSVVRDDEAGAKDVVETIGRALTAKGVKGVVFKAYEFSLVAHDGGPKLHWVMARSGNRVFAVGDEEYVMTAEMPAKEAMKLTLSRQEKLDLLGRLVSAPAASGSAGSDARRQPGPRPSVATPAR